MIFQTLIQKCSKFKTIVTNNLHKNTAYDGMEPLILLAGLLFFSEKNTDGCIMKREGFPQTIGQIAFIREVDVCRIADKKYKSGRFNGHLGDVVKRIFF